MLWKAYREWRELVLAAEGDELRLSLDGKLVCAHRSAGFAPPEKSWLSLSAPNTVWVDDIKLWKSAPSKDQLHAPPQGESTDKTLRSLPAPLCLAQEMGQGLGAGSLLQRALSDAIA